MRNPTPKEKEPVEALMRKPAPKGKVLADFSSYALRIRRIRKPPIIKGPPRIFESSDEEMVVKPKGPTIASLSAKVITMREEIRKLNGRLAKSLIKTRNLEDDIHDLCLG